MQAFEVIPLVLVELPEVDAVTARRLTASVLGDILVRKPEPVQVADQVEQALELALLVLSVPQAELPLPFADVHENFIPRWHPATSAREVSGRLPPFALWPAFPTSDYYGGSDAPQVSPAGYRLRCRGASHVHG